jgi:acyl carrier protein
LAGELAARGARVTRARFGETLPVAGRVVSFVGQDEADFGGVPHGLWATTALVQAVESPVWAVTSGAVSTGPGDRVSHPLRAAVWGLGRAVALEEPGRWGGLVDVPVEADPASLGRLVEVLAGGEDQVAVRGGVVLGRRLVHGRAPQKPAWSPSGTVLITGGTGALGARVARWVLDQGAGRVVLASRRGPAAGADLGEAVEAVACDVTVRAEVEALLARFEFSAVVHAAGVLDDGVVDGLTVDRLAGVWAPKAGAAWALHEALADRHLDAFVLFSSAAGVWGGAGQGSYAAANAALDALVEYRRGLGLPGASIAWGPWAEAGMAADEAVRARLGRGGLTPLDPEVAVKVLASASGCETVADVDWERYVPGVTAVRASHLWDELAPPSEQPTPTRGLGDRLAGLSGVARRTVVTDMVRGCAAAVLGFADPAGVEVSKSFRDLGFDSLTAVELRNALAAETGQKLPSTLVFDHPTPQALAEFLISRLPDADEAGDTGTELDRLEAALLALPGPEVARLRVTARLQQLVKRLEGAADEAPVADISARIGAATSDDIFDLIDNEIGAR